MTGQVKEEVLTRFAELGVTVHGGRISFRPLLLRKSEFLREPAELSTFDLDGEPLTVPLSEGTLAFTYCQVPIVFHQSDKLRVVLTKKTGREEISGDTLPAEASASLFARTGQIQRIDVWTKPGC
jgi:hypothetical protein